MSNVLNILLLVEVTSNPVAIKTENGVVEGIYLDVGTGKQVIAWLGIPFAQVKRFEPPGPARKWNKPLNASKYGPTCWQDVKESYYGSVYWNNLETFDEDCLTLNIYKPAKLNLATKLSVLVWVHSGAFTYGSSAVNLFDLKEFVSFTNTIAISINYRLDVFGFLRTGNKIKGNMGLLDQQQTLIWINKNIKRFGGDPNKVTLAGEGAGGISVSYHLLAESSKKLFQQAIILNGDPIDNWYFDTKQKISDKTNKLGEVLGCPINEEALVTCLKSKSVESIMKALPELVENTFDQIPFGPTVDNVILKDSPRKLLSKSKSLKGIKILVGINKNAGSLAAREVLPMADNIKMDEDTFKFSTEIALSRLPQDIQEKATEYYMTNERKDSNLVKTFNNLVGNLKYTCTTQWFADILSEKEADVRKVFFNHRPSHSKWPKWAGVVQQDELMFILGEPNKQTPVIAFSEKEKKLSRRLMELFGKFVKQKKLENWPKYDNKNRKTLKVEDGKLKTVKKHFYREKFCNFWKENNVFN